MITTPLLMLLLMIAVQAGVWWHANHVAQSVAAHALAAARVDGGSVETGRAAGERVLAQLGNRLLVNPAIEVQRTEVTARVEVTATVPPVIPGVALPVQVSASGVTESAP